MLRTARVRELINAYRADKSTARRRRRPFRVYDAGLLGLPTTSGCMLWNFEFKRLKSIYAILAFRIKT